MPSLVLESRSTAGLMNCLKAIGRKMYGFAASVVQHCAPVWYAHTNQRGRLEVVQQRVPKSVISALFRK